MLKIPGLDFNFGITLLVAIGKGTVATIMPTLSSVTISIVSRVAKGTVAIPTAQVGLVQVVS